MIVIPNQYFGLGDIIFCQTLAKRVANGNRIVWPVMPQFVEGLQRAYPDVTFVDWTTFKIDYNRKTQYTFYSEQIKDDCTVLPFRWAAEIMGKGYKDWMKAKYELYGLDWQIWREDATWVHSREHELYNLMGINGLPYNLYNNTFGSDSKLKATVLQADNGISSIELHVKPGFSLFDWGYIIQNAISIHTVNTSIIYLLEMLELKAPEIHLYQRSIPGQTFDGIDYILQKHKYVFHG